MFVYVRLCLFFPDIDKVLVEKKKKESRNKTVGTLVENCLPIDTLLSFNPIFRKIRLRYNEIRKFLLNG